MKEEKCHKQTEKVSELRRENVALREKLAQMRAVINVMADKHNHPEFKTRLFDDFLQMVRCHRRTRLNAKQ